MDAGEKNPHVDRDSGRAPGQAARAGPPGDRQHPASPRAGEAEASAATRNAAQALVDSGLSHRDGAHLLGLSHQRVHQLLGST